MTAIERSNFERSDRVRVRRIPERGHYDRETIFPIIDEALICHVGFAVDGQPFVIPTIHARDGDEILLHGARSGRMLKHIRAGNGVCITCTHLDGLVLARSVFHSSMNYRSAVIFGTGTVIEDEEEKMRGFQILTEHLAPGRWSDARHPNPKEMNATALISVRIEEASAKIRTGPAADDDEDYSLPIWAGVIPIRQQFLPTVSDDRLSPDIPVPPYVVDYRRNG